MEKRKRDESQVLESFRAIAKKMAAQHLSREEINSIVSDISNKKLHESDIARFLVATQKHGMSSKEICWLTESMANTGEILSWKDKIVGDKHCIGGIAGNRTSPIVVAICAAAGITMPKTSSRSITSAAGTADTVETIARVDLSIEEIRRVIDKAGACLVWGGSLGLVPLDDMMIRLERTLNLNPVPQLLASIFSKKLSAGSTHILIDIPYGKSAKVDKAKALKLKKEFLLLGKHFKKKVKVVLTDGSQPIGNGVGPILEMFDVLSVLRRDNGPTDLENKSVMLAGQLLEMTGKSTKGKGEEKARHLLDSGQALRAFERIIDAQGRIKPTLRAPFSFTIFANRSGKIKHIDNKHVNYLAKFLGCPTDKGAGVYLHKHVGESVSKGEPVMTLYAESKGNLRIGKDFLSKNFTFSIS